MYFFALVRYLLNLLKLLFHLLYVKIYKKTKIVWNFVKVAESFCIIYIVFLNFFKGF